MTNCVPCPECGQLITFDAPEDVTEEQAAALALLHCSCPVGRKAALIKMQVDEAKFNIDNLCGINAADGSIEPIYSKKTIELLYKAVELLADNKLFSMTAKLPGNSTVTVSVGTKGQIKVKRSISVSEQLEANQKF